MAGNITVIRALVVPRIKDAAGKLSTIEDGEVDQAIRSALELYSKHRPLEKALALPGAGTFKLAVSSLTGFVDGFSSVLRVAHPFDAAARDIPWLDDDEWRLERTDAGLFLWFLSASPAASESVLAVYTIPHSLPASGTAGTVPAADDNALADLAAAFACEMLAGFYTQSVDSPISADAVDRKSKAAEYRSLAKVYRDRYGEKIGSGADDGVPSAGTIIEVDRAFGGRSRTDFFFHGRRTH